MTQNQLRYWELQETKRSNAAREDETYRSNTAQENLKRGDQDIERSKLAETAKHNRASEYVASGTLLETQRSNKAREYETNRSNMAKEAETHRSNTTKERETERSNRANEAISWSNLAENKRHNMAGEEISAGALAESIRHNTASEFEINRANTASEAIKSSQLSLDQSKLDETIRHNKREEKIKSTANTHNAIAGYMKGAGSLIGSIGKFVP